MTAAHANHKSQISFCFLWFAHKPCVTGLRQKPAVISSHKQILSVTFIISEGLLKNHWARHCSYRKPSAWKMLKLNSQRIRSRMYAQRGKEQIPQFPQLTEQPRIIIFVLNFRSSRATPQAGYDLHILVRPQTFFVATDLRLIFSNTQPSQELLGASFTHEISQPRFQPSRTKHALLPCSTCLGGSAPWCSHIHPLAVIALSAAVPGHWEHAALCLGSSHPALCLWSSKPSLLGA